MLTFLSTYPSRLDKATMLLTRSLPLELKVTESLNTPTLICQPHTLELGLPRIWYTPMPMFLALFHLKLETPPTTMELPELVPPPVTSEEQL